MQGRVAYRTSCGRKASAKPALKCAATCLCDDVMETVLAVIGVKVS